MSVSHADRAKTTRHNKRCANFAAYDRAERKKSRKFSLRATIRSCPSSFRTVCTGHARRAAHRENRRRNHLSDARGVWPHRSSSAKIHHFRQRHRLRPARPAQDHARHDDLVLRRLCLMAKRRHRKRQWTPTSMAAAPPGYRPDISDQDIQEIVLTTNLTPRKCLGFNTPFQALLAELGKDVQIRFS